MEPSECAGACAGFQAMEKNHMTALRIIREIITIAIGIGAIVVTIAFDAEPWVAALGACLIAWGAWDIYKELRDSSRSGDVGEMAAERERIRQKSQQER
jgi:hypothetical protein